MLRSFDYAAAQAIANFSDGTEGAEARALGLMETFREVSTKRFLAGYAEAGGRAEEHLLDLALLEKAAYEVAYEASNRPDWLPTPLHGLAEIADRLLEEPRP